ncbi:MAG: hypothetical protein U0176_12165 [Bacteroidia bacterium]
MEEFTVQVPAAKKQFFIDLMEQLGYGIHLVPENEVLAAQKEEVERRIASNTPSEYRPWEEVVARIRSKK